MGLHLFVPAMRLSINGLEMTDRAGARLRGIGGSVILELFHLPRKRHIYGKNTLQGAGIKNGVAINDLVPVFCCLLFGFFVGMES